MSQERTEKATPKKREDARKKGQIARGPELPSALGLLAALVALYMFSGTMIETVQAHIRASALQIVSTKPLTDTDLHLILLEAGKFLAYLTVPVALLGVSAAVAGNVAQGGLSFTGAPFLRGGEKLNPVSNLKRIFGPDALVNLVKSVIKLIFISAVAYAVLQPVAAEAPSLLNASIQTVGTKLGEILFALAFRSGIVLLLLAAADYGYAYYKHEKSLRMSKQEIRDEYKQQEGDPMVKGMRRRAARAIAQKRSLVEVAGASVVITNPTHFAVALRYDRSRDAAPTVVAKGADLFAAKIREIARENDVPLVENPPLARGLYKVVEPNQTIPVEFFGAVAEVLAYVYRKDEAMGGAGRN